MVPHYLGPETFPEGTGKALLQPGCTVELADTDVYLLDAAGERTDVVFRNACEGGEGQRVALPGIAGEIGERITADAEPSAKASFLNVCSWGLCRPGAYAERGWPVAEYSIARFNRRICNLEEPP